jgi:hypothetical protein
MWSPAAPHLLFSFGHNFQKMVTQSSSVISRQSAQRPVLSWVGQDGIAINAAMWHLLMIYRWPAHRLSRL